MSAASIEMVVLDWAGTAVDFGSMAPILALEDVFTRNGIAVTRTQLRLSMGLAKKDHIREVLALREIAAKWQEHYGSASTEADVERLYAEFTPRMMDEITPSSVLIPGVREFASALRQRGIKLGGTTGYTRAQMERLMHGAAQQGYQLDLSLCPEDVGGGRPHPWMCCRLAIELRVSALARCVKIGDTPSDMAEGRNAGMWTIGVTTTGNSVGLPPQEWLGLSPDQQAAAQTQAESELKTAGAHFVIDSAAQALPLLDEIEARIARGERP
jgi:phosphonoacetaldehyde hydrolase